MAVVLNPCVRDILCGLSGSTLSALKALITAQSAQLNVLLAEIDVKLQVLNVLTIPVQIAANAAEAVIQQVKEAGNLVPVALIQNCVDLNGFSFSLNSTLDSLTAQLEDQERDLNRLLSVTQELEFLKIQYRAILEQFDAVIQVLATCGGTPA